MNTKQTTQILLSVIAFIAILSTILYYFAGELNSVYIAKLQTPLFTGFLTLGSFLLTLKIFIIVQLKERLYDSDIYIERIAKKRFLNKNLALYGPLERLAELLLIAVIMALTTAILQLSLGFVAVQITSAICLSFAIGTLMLVIFVWWQIRTNIHDLFEIAAETKEKAILEKQEALKKPSTVEGI